MSAHWQLGYKYADEALNSIVDTVDEPNTMQDSYGILDGSIGVASLDNGWGVELFGSNLTDERAQLHINRQDFFEKSDHQSSKNDWPESLLRPTITLVNRSSLGCSDSLHPSGFSE